jgi:hypothetical protein
MQTPLWRDRLKMSAALTCTEADAARKDAEAIRKLAEAEQARKQSWAGHAKEARKAERAGSKMRAEAQEGGGSTQGRRRTQAARRAEERAGS